MTTKKKVNLDYTPVTATRCLRRSTTRTYTTSPSRGPANSKCNPENEPSGLETVSSNNQNRVGKSKSINFRRRFGSLTHDSRRFPNIPPTTSSLEPTIMQHTSRKHTVRKRPITEGGGSSRANTRKGSIEEPACTSMVITTITATTKFL